MIDYYLKYGSLSTIIMFEKMFLDKKQFKTLKPAELFLAIGKLGAYGNSFLAWVILDIWIKTVI